MSAEATRPDDWLAGLAAGCERLVHPSASGRERARQRRLLGVLLAGPFIVAAAIVQALAPVLGAAGTLAALCAAFGASWLAAIAVAARGRSREAELVALGGGAILVGLLIAMSGGPGTPAAALLAVLPLEAWWVARSRRAATAGMIAAGGALLLALAATGEAAPVSAGWLWLSPLAYGATLALRLTGQGAEPQQQEDPAPGLAEDCFDGAVARLNRAGEVESISAQAHALLGVEPTLLLGAGLFERIHVGDRVAFLCAAAQTRDTGASSRCALRIRMPLTADGEGGGYRPFEAEIVKPSAASDAVAAIIRDGRETAALRETLQEAVEQASATEVAKGRFLAAVSHELRTPLNAVIGFSDMLLHRDISGELMPRQAEHVTLIREAGNHLLSVVNAILDVSKIEAGSYRITVEPFDLKPAVELCRAMLEPQAAEKQVTLSVKLPSGLDQIAGDQRAVQQILLNLLSNAVKFTPEGGNVSVNAVANDGMVRIFVNDTGIGIGAEDLARLGQPFMQVQNDYTRQFQGTGLGLSLVKGLVKLHGGSMSMESAPGLGTTVTIGLPLASAAAADATVETGDEDGIALRKSA